ncbi:unnamed protein product, partial [Ectocarpus sp. 4 AP-2014]
GALRTRGPLTAVLAYVLSAACCSGVALRGRYQSVDHAKQGREDAKHQREQREQREQRQQMLHPAGGGGYSDDSGEEGPDYSSD